MPQFNALEQPLRRPQWPELRRRVRAAAIRDVVVLGLLYAVPALRRFRRWYWRGALTAAVVGGAVGLAAAYGDRRKALD